MAADRFTVVLAKVSEGGVAASHVLIDDVVVNFGGEDSCRIDVVTGHTYTLILYNYGVQPGSTTVTMNRADGGAEVMTPLKARVLKSGAGFGARKFQVA